MKFLSTLSQFGKVTNFHFEDHFRAPLTLKNVAEIGLVTDFVKGHKNVESAFGIWAIILKKHMTCTLKFDFGTLNHERLRDWPIS